MFVHEKPVPLLMLMPSLALWTLYHYSVCVVVKSRGKLFLSLSFILGASSLFTHMYEAIALSFGKKILRLFSFEEICLQNEPAFCEYFE